MEDFTVIHFERTGGFAGLTISYTIDIRTLDPEESNRLRSLIPGSEMKEKIRQGNNLPGNHSDQFQYKLVLEKDDQREIFSLSESQVPEDFQPLIRYLLKKSRTK